jgi:2-dehydro-3-deoxyphosphogluconate aldolase / (4S)-4-hydroxy-2-oxoglutarate aldolase
MQIKMDNHSEIIKKIRQQRILPLYYHDDAQVCIEVAKALYAAGIRIIEFTNRGAAALDNFKLLVQLRNNEMNDLLLATGTVRSVAEVELFANAGADFLISPIYDTTIGAAAKQKNILWIPGCATPTEIHIAERAGCGIIKLFPGNILGPSFVAAIKELFPATHFMPTGGVETTRENLQQWFNAGVCAVGMGSRLITKELLETKNYKAIEQAARETLAVIQTIK